MNEPFRVFWQPGCSSCLKAKEFLKSHGVAFESVNVLADESGFDDLQALGAKSVPVVSCGSEFVFAQNLSDVADFIGVARTVAVLSPAELTARLDRVLAAALSHARQLPQEISQRQLPGRDRTYLDLAYHIFVIAEAFVEAAQGGTLTYDFFERRPPHSIKEGHEVAVFGQSIREAVSVWWGKTNHGAILPDQLLTYYGPQSVPDLLERTTWHTAQHARQLEAVLSAAGVQVADALTDADLKGLPLPDHVYDDEVSLSDEAR